MISSSQPVHSRAQWRRPIAYRTTVADPPKFLRLVVLRSSCDHVLGVGYVWRHQGFIAWRRCPR